MGKNRRQAVRHGYIVIDKPAGWSSHDVVARVRRIVDERRVGHAGTLDPAATGVLPVAVGLATRTVEYLSASSKDYRAWIQFGVTTDTADSDGAVTGRRDATGLDLDKIELALASFRGVILQKPPMHSAVKVNGKRLYELARQGVEIDVVAREVTIHALRIMEWSAPVLCVDLQCSKGTYVRSLARDLGEAVGAGAILSRLVRTRTGPFTLCDAIALDDLERTIDEGDWERIAFPPDTVLRDCTAFVLEPARARDWGHGKAVEVEPIENATPVVRAYDVQGRWLGVGEFDAVTSSLRPVKVVPTE